MVAGPRIGALKSVGCEIVPWASRGSARLWPFLPLFWDRGRGAGQELAAGQGQSRRAARVRCHGTALAERDPGNGTRREEGAGFPAQRLFSCTEFPARGISAKPPALLRRRWAGEKRAASPAPWGDEVLTVEVTFLNPCFGQTFPISAEEKPASSSFLSLLSIFLPSSPG